MSPALKAVEALYFNSQQNLNDMLAATQTKEQHDQIMSQYVQTRQNYFACINKTFHDDDPALVAIVSQANTTADEIKAIDTQLGDIAKVIGIMTQAVTYGAQIVAKIVTL